MKKLSRWPLVALAAPAFVAIWGGWVGLGEMAGFGEINLLPGIAPDRADLKPGETAWATINSAITLPIGVEAYAAYALRAWLAAGVPARAREFAKWSAIGALLLGAAGQVAYHLLAAHGVTTAPALVTTAVSCFPVAVLGMGAALAHLLNGGDPADETEVAGRAVTSPANEPATSVATERPADAVAVATLPAMATAKPRPSARPPLAADTATRVAKLVAKDAAIDAATVATKLAISERTARRHLAAARAAAAPVNGRVPDLAEVTSS